MKLRAANNHKIDDIKIQIETAQKEAEATTLRINRIAIEKQLTVLHRKLKKKENDRFLKEIQCDTKLGKQINEFIKNEKPTAKAVRQFALEVRSK